MGHGEAASVMEACRPGDWIEDRGPDRAWQALRRGLAMRGLAVVSVGRRLFVAPEAAEAQLPLLRQLASAWGEDRVARAALKDLAAELFGPRPGLAQALADGCRRAHASGRTAGEGSPAPPAGDSPPPAGEGGHRQVPGGGLTTSPLPTPGAALRAATKPAAKLSKLQRALLLFARDHDGGWPGAPLSLRGAQTRSGAAAASRALRRLEARGLLRVTRTAGGRATHVLLTDRATRLVLGQ
jgi:hypothetical protein